ncbi:MotA/TolQ/ExbB proton channel family protein [Pleionea mediterranea]|uniref:Outer membrane transport energization protein ExbB n=1 Tax=Pleionea mediterranea TaxID=523701 RepID=A0A316GB35_9GAMM|nr:MotA/TolQ/ExbB proton channel family protein [Pleionea mediterranea]PWK51717.1 outer membrane transport energization protein ExbB [Pleionea mediterranea]
MVFITESFDGLQAFLETGGPVLSYIGVLIFVMWVLILERLSFMWLGYRQYRKSLINRWMSRSDRDSWNAEQIRIAMVSRAKLRLNKSLPMIQAMVALCPLLGLLGTVTGMIEVFNVMTISGTGNARSMASGVSKATIPTMAGMVGALPGVFAASYLKRTAKRETELLEDKLILDH